MLYSRPTILTAPTLLPSAAMSKTPALPAASNAHPLLYASLIPIESADRGLPCIDLYKPKAKYSLGRSPESDVVLDSQSFEWSYCTLLWDGKDEVSITDLFSVNGVWVNRRPITPGEPHILRDGDTVFFAMCGLEKPEEDRESPRYEFGDDWAYIYRQYTDRPPPLAPDHQDSWTRLDELGRSRRRVEDELDRLKRERDAILQETQSILEELPALPSPVHSDLADELKEVWAGWDDFRKKRPAEVILPEDFRELFRPNTDDLPYYKRWRSDYQTMNRVRPPPLLWGPPGGGWTKCYHRSGWPDWNNPDLVWDGLMPLDQSRPLTIPPSIIYWSAKYKLPVYAHPRFEPGSSRIYARSYSRSTDGFSDYSAAEQRQELKLPPLEDPPITSWQQKLLRYCRPYVQMTSFYLSDRLVPNTPQDQRLRPDGPPS
ncbi:hypothetical protein PENSPDRAFT_189346 [Peniophora sp. CONT]|nr:hypothetical protein PENSPDRAFT_189346 [Peniophora sp. CONT]